MTFCLEHKAKAGMGVRHAQGVKCSWSHKQEVSWGNNKVAFSFLFSQHQRRAGNLSATSGLWRQFSLDSVAAPGVPEALLRAAFY